MKRLRVFFAALGRRTVDIPWVTPPLGLLSLAAYVRDCLQAEVQVVDQCLDNMPLAEMMRKAEAFRADFVGFRAVTSFAYLLREATAAAHAVLPRALVGIGGPHATASGARALEGTDADVAVVGEGERTLEQVLLALADGASFDGIPGLVWRTQERDVVVNPGEMSLVSDLDTLPFPAYDLIDVRRYWRVRPMGEMAPRPYMALLSSRGCPYQCIYCHRCMGKEFRAQSPEYVVDEIEQFRRMYGVDEFDFLDDVFNFDGQRVVGVAEELKRRDLRVRMVFPNGLRTDILTHETVEALAEAGTCYAACPLESGSPRVQKLIQKHLNIPRYLEGVRLLGEHGVFTHGFTMVGFPTETEAEMQQTVDTVCQSRLHTTTFFTVIPYPGTQLLELAEQTCPEKLAGLTSYDDTNYNSVEVNFSAMPDAVFYRCKRKAWRRFYANPVRIGRILKDFSHKRYLPQYIIPMVKHLCTGIVG